VAYSQATPFHLAQTLIQLVDRSPLQRHAAAVAAADSVHATTWAEAGAQFERAVRNVVYTRAATGVAA
jgi:hypothetical protein